MVIQMIFMQTMRFLSYLLLFSILEISFYNFSHIHTDETVHLHADNVLVSEHAKPVNPDCAICDLIVNSSLIFLFKNWEINLSAAVYEPISVSTAEIIRSTELSYHHGRAPPARLVS